VFGDAAIKLNNLRRMGSDSAAKPSARPAACDEVSAVSETGPQQFFWVAVNRFG